MHRDHPFGAGIFKCPHRIQWRGMALSHKKLRLVGPYSPDKIVYRRKDFSYIPKVAAVARIATKVNGFARSLNHKASPKIAIGVAPIAPSPMSGRNVADLQIFRGLILLIPSRSLYFLTSGKSL